MDMKLSVDIVEWDQIWPEWLETMNDFRSQRLEEVVYQSRRTLFASEYAKYVMSPSPNTPAFDLLPHAADVACLPPFRDIIRAPEGTEMGDKPFESAFSQLPELVDEWRKKLDVEVAELVEIPSHLSFRGTPDGGIVASGSTRGSESSRAPTDKLRLACALFQGGFEGVFTHPDVFSTSMRDSTYPYPRVKGDMERTGSLRDRYGIAYAAEAPYVIHACGLDPNVATADDKDRRDARLKCLSCQSSRVRRWRDAVAHAHSYHRDEYGPESPRWQVVDDKYLASILAAELSLDISDISRCLLCLPCVGDARFPFDTCHLKYDHNIEEADAQPCVHYAPLNRAVEMCSVKMVDEGGEVTFSEPLCFGLI
ncbi:hypothetical protein HD554DRAFT_2226611 [Boletus coccyginus]|nr:hypothetical protein HD554DRAFT_2226611 [Boletus coccyginus]